MSYKNLLLPYCTQLSLLNLNETECREYPASWSLPKKKKEKKFIEEENGSESNTAVEKSVLK